MPVKSHPTPEISIAQLARDLNKGRRAWRNFHAITTRLFAFICHVTTTSFITRSANIPFCHRPCNIYDHMVMTYDVVIKEVNPFFGLYLSVKHNVFTVQTRKYDSVFFKIILKLCEFSNTPSAI